MKIAVFGASGRTGRPLVEAALAQGHDVTAFVRTPAKLGITHEKLRVVQGTVQDAGRVAEAVQGQDAVFSALGPEKPDYDTMTVGLGNIISAMRKHGARRLIVQTGAGVSVEGDRPGFMNHFIRFLLKTISPKVLADSEAGVAKVTASPLDWTVVRVPRLMDGPATGKLRVGMVGDGVGAALVRADAAEFMLRQLTDTAQVRKQPAISN